LKVAVGLGSDEALDLAHRFARRHPSDRMRLAAWDALAARESEFAAREGLWREAEGSGSRLVEMEARRRRAEPA
ncbi:MAG: transposase, partial [Novosphingobium sp.]